jgi:hypothetical protein
MLHTEGAPRKQPVVLTLTWTSATLSEQWLLLLLLVSGCARKFFF